jgi:hypothetical protein
MEIIEITVWGLVFIYILFVVIYLFGEIWIRKKRKKENERKFKLVENKHAI